VTGMVAVTLPPRPLAVETPFARAPPCAPNAWMVTLVTPAGTVNCCAAPVKSNVCEPVIGVAVGVAVAVGVLVAVAVGAPIGVAVAVAATAVGVFVGTGDWAATGVGATID